MIGSTPRSCAAAHSRKCFWHHIIGCIAVVALCLTSTASAQLIIDVPPDVAPASIASDTILNLDVGGVVGDDFELFDVSVLNVNGGALGRYVNIRDHATVNVFSGSVGTRVLASDAATVNVFGGTIDDQFGASTGTTINVSGGSFGTGFSGSLGATVNISGGNFGTGFVLFGDGTISGGTFDNVRFDATGLLMRGYDFALDGMPVAGLDIVGDSVPFNVPFGELFTGNFADGTPFAFHWPDRDQITADIFTLERSAVPASGPALIQLPGDAAPLGIVSGQTLVVNDGGTLADNFNVGSGGALEVNGGSVGSNLEIVDATLQMSAGNLGSDLDVFRGATATLTGGRVDGSAEVYDGGVLNVGGDAVIETVVEILAGGTLNMSGAGRIGTLRTEPQSEVNMDGGEIRQGRVEVDAVFNMTAGEVTQSLAVERPESPGMPSGTLNLDGGAVSRLSARLGATVNIRGGSLGDYLLIDNADILIEGVGFEIDGVPVAGLGMPGNTVSIDVTGSSMITGQFADGSPFVISEAEGDEVVGNLTFKRVDPAPAPSTVTVPGDDVRYGARPGQTLTVTAGGTLPNHFNAGEGSQVIVDGGTIGYNFEAYRATVIVESGQIGDDFDAFDGTLVEVRGGTIGRDADLYAGTTLLVSGGAIGGGLDVFGDVIVSGNGEVGQGILVHDGGTLVVDGGRLDGGIDAAAGSTVEINGGTVGRNLNARGGSHVDINGGNVGQGLDVYRDGSVDVRGGTIGRDLGVRSGTGLTLHGSEFLVNGVPIAELMNDGDTTMVFMAGNTYLTGTLADGTPIAVAPRDEDRVYQESIRLVQTPTAPVGPALIEVPSNDAPLGIRGGQRLVLGTGGVLADNFVAGPGAVVEINDGTVGENLEAVAADVFVRGGTVGEHLGLFPGSHLEISGGEVGGVNVMPGASLTMPGGTLGSLSVASGSIVHLQGGAVESAHVGGLLHIDGGSKVNVFNVHSANSHVVLADGEIGNGMRIEPGATVDLLGGVVGDNMNVQGAVLNITDATMGSNAYIAGSDVSISGSRRNPIGSNWYVTLGSTVDVEYARFGSNLQIHRDAVINIRDGVFSGKFTIFPRAEANISGGIFLGTSVHELATIHFTGTSFLLDGQSIDGLENDGDSILLDATVDNVLDMVLLDGLSWQAEFNEDIAPIGPFTIHPNAIVRLTLSIPEPSAIVLAMLAAAMTAILPHRSRR